MTDAVNIRPAYPFDADRILAWRAEESVRQYQPLGDQSLDSLRQELSRSHDDLRRGQSRRFCWIIEAPRPVGWMTLSVLSWEHRLAEIGFSLTESARGRGIMRQALTQVVELLFSRSMLDRIEAHCDLRNEASAGVLEACGFRREGVLRGYFVLDGKRRDNALYAILREDLAP